MDARNENPDTCNISHDTGRKSFVSDTITLVSGTTVAQFIAIIASPLIARIYGADLYGIYALFTSIVGILTVASCMRYEMSILLPKTDREAANLLALSIMLAAVTSSLSALAIWLFGDPILNLIGDRSIQPYFWLVPPMVFLSGTFLAINYWNSRGRRFGNLSKAQVSKSVVYTSTAIGAGLSGFTTGGSLIGANVVAQAAATSVLSYRVWKSDWRLIRRSINWNDIICGLRKYRNFPLFDIWSALINAITLQLPIFILTAFFTSTIVGYYSLGLAILQLPMSIIGSAIAQVFFQRAAEVSNGHEGKLSQIVESVVGRLIAVGLLPMILVSILGEDLFTVVFGISWAEAGIYAQILSFLMFFRFICSPISTLFTVQNRLRAFLVFTTVLMFVSAGSLIWGGISNDIYLGLAMLSFLGGMIYLLFTYWIFSETNVSITRAIKPIKMSVILGFIVFILLIIIKYVLNLGPIPMVICGFICASIYYTALLRWDNQLKKMVYGYLRIGKLRKQSAR